MSVGVSIAIGVLTGVLSAILIAFSSIIYQSIVLPWFQAKVYRGVLISGTWSGKMEINGVQWKLTLVIKQRGNKVKGTFNADSDNPDARKKKTNMVFCGSIYDGFLIITCTATDPHDISFGSMILRIKNRQMSGQQIFRDLSESEHDVFRSKVEFSYES